jgi:uridine phosphorylase
MRHSVRIGSIGDVNTSLSPGNYVLYPPGAMAEAQRVALMLPGTPPAVEPIQPQLQEATGTHDQIVVVLD